MSRTDFIIVCCLRFPGESYVELRFIFILKIEPFPLLDLIVENKDLQTRDF